MLNKRIHKLLFPALLLLVCLIAYLPLSSFLFSMKNDAFIFNFPNKFFFSESIRQGSLPTWNPYLNYGFPLFADPGFAWWHPVTWLFGVIGYNAYTFSIEILLYIYIGGIGMYWFGKTLNLKSSTCFALGCMFMCSGFFIGNLQHINFLTSASFLPWLIGSWLKYQNNTSLKNLFFCGLSAFLLCAAGHPAIPIGTIYFTFFLTCSYFILFRKRIKTTTFILNQIKLLAFIILFLTPLIYSYITIQPYYTRFEPANQLTSINTGFTIQSYLSFVFPFATIKNQAWFETDVSMRNAYFSFLGFIFFVFFLVKKNKNTHSILFLFPGIFMLLLAAGGVTKVLLYEHLPGLQYIRTNGEFRIFSIFSFIICGAFHLELLFLKQKESLSVKKYKRWIFLLLFIGLAILSTTFLMSIKINSEGLISGTKYLLDHLSFQQCFIIAGIIFFIISILYLFALTRKRSITGFILFALVMDLILNSWALLPITGVGKTSVAHMQSIINKSPKGFPKPTFNKEKEPLLTKEEIPLVGNWAWYAKNFANPQIDYPSMLNSTQKFINSKDSNFFRGKSFAFFISGRKNQMIVERFSPHLFSLKVHSPEADTLVLLQNDFPGWKVTRNNVDVKPIVYAKTFMAIPVQKGESIIKWKFSSQIILVVTLWGAMIFFLILIGTFFLRQKNVGKISNL
jgi:hypothetical protein